MDTVASILGNTPYFYPLLGAAIAIILFALFAPLMFLIVILFTPELRAPAADPGSGSDPTGSKSSVGSAATIIILQAYIPGYGYLMGAYQLVVNQFQALIESFGAFATISFPIFLLSGILATFAAIILSEGIPLLAGFNEFYACDALPAINFVLGLANLADLGLGSVWPFVTFGSSLTFDFVVPGLATRVLLSCTLTLSGNVFVTMFAALAQVIETFFTAIQDFTNQEDLLTARMDFIPFSEALGDVSSVLTAWMQCLCVYLTLYASFTHLTSFYRCLMSGFRRLLFHRCLQYARLDTSSHVSCVDAWGGAQLSYHQRRAAVSWPHGSQYPLLLPERHETPPLARMHSRSSCQSAERTHTSVYRRLDS